MDIQPILAAMRRNKFGAILICIQMAVTIAVLCNAVFVIQQRIAWTQAPTGLDEQNIFTIKNKWIGHPDQAPLTRTKADLAALRGLAGVEDAYASNSFPLMGYGQTGYVNIEPDQRNPTANASMYFTDEHALHTLGLKLTAGRNFSASEVTDLTFTTADLSGPPIGILITQSLAKALFPHESAVGKAIYYGMPRPLTIIGIVERLQGQFARAGGWGSDFRENTMIAPGRLPIPEIHYVVRTRPGQMAGVMREAQRTLLNADPLRILTDVRSFRTTRLEAYRDDRAFVLILVVVCVIMLAVTALGIVGLTSYWVTQRQRQIGIRRALGGTRLAILRYFLTENLLIAMVATVFGCALTLGFNLWAVSTFEMARLPYFYPAVGGGAILLLGQAAAFWPARRASVVSPALAARSV
jgi:putative ABC transport system permease protein